MKTPNVHDPSFWQGQPDDELRDLRRTCPVAAHQDEDFWVVAGHEDISRISKDPATYSSAKGVLIGDRKRAVGAADSILYIDPPRHVTHRRIVHRACSVRGVAVLAPVVERITRDAL